MTCDRNTKHRFNLGRIVITANALNELDPDDVQRCLYRHAQGDWGDLPEEDHASNERAISGVVEDRLMSVYDDKNGKRFWIITEHDRSVTTILLPEDY